MRQKYIIDKNVEQEELRISEYAVLDTHSKYRNALMVQQHNFSLIGEEKYDHQDVMQSIPTGREAVVDLLRTKNLFPIEPYAKEIAETVIALFRSSQDSTAEILFDDTDLLSTAQNEDTAHA